MVALRWSLLCVLIQFFSLFSHHDDSCVYNGSSHKDIPHVVVEIDPYKNESPSLNCSFRLIQAIPKYCVSHVPLRNFLARSGSAQLKNYFDMVIAPAMYTATIANAYSAIPGYSSPHGLRDFLIDTLQFSSFDEDGVITKVNGRLESYITRIENVLFEGKDRVFCQTISPETQIKLAQIYADFLMEYYPHNAKQSFEKSVCGHPVLHNCSNGIQWKDFDHKSHAIKKRAVATIYARSANGKLGEVYRAMHAKEYEKAYALGQEKVITTIPGKWYGKTQETTSFAESYPELATHVERIYCAQRADIQELHMRQANAAHSNHITDTAHAVVPEIQRLINAEHLTVNGKNVSLSGTQQQHLFLDESLFVFDTVVTQDLSGKIQDVVVGLANESISLNKAGDIPTTACTLDTCWQLLDFTEKAARYAYKSFSDNLPILTAIIEGSAESFGNAIHCVNHPEQVGIDVIKSFATLGYCVGKLTHAVAQHSAACDAIMAELDPARVKEMMQEHAHDHDFMFALCDRAKNISKVDAARFGGKFVTDLLIMHYIGNLTTVPTQQALPAFAGCMEKGFIESAAEVALAAEEISVQCAEEVAALMNAVQKVEAAVPVGAKALELAKNAPELLRTFNIAHYDASIGNLQKLEQAIERLKDIPGALTKDGPLFKALEFGKKMEILPEPLTITQFNSRLTTARGAMYEVEKALELIEAGEEIVNMGLSLKGREFDIITKSKFIECKNIDWSSKTAEYIENTKKIFGMQKKIATEEGKIFEVVSKKPLPESLKAWFLKKEILFFEEIL